MSDRKNLKIDTETYGNLRDAKRTHETWNHFFNRLLRERDDS